MHIAPFALALLAAIAPAAASDTPADTGPDTNAPEVTDDASAGLFDCEQLSWLETCKRINRQYRADPNTHLRIINRDGVELNFPPNTPTAAIRFYTLQTPESAEAYVRHLRAKMDHAKRSAEMFKRARSRMGIATSAEAIIGPQPMSPKSAPSLPIDKVKVYVFYRARDAASEGLLNAIERLQFNYPELYISALQMDRDSALLNRFNKRFGLDARILDGKAREVWASRIDHFPMTIFEHIRSGKQVRMSGDVSMKRLLATLTTVAQEKTQ